MRWKYIHDIAGDKGQTVYEAMNFYSTLKSKDYAKKVIEKLFDNIWMLQSEDRMFLKDPSEDLETVCPESFQEYVEITMADSIIHLHKNNVFSEFEKSSKYIASEIQQLYSTGKVEKMDDESKKAVLKESIWAIDDEKMAIQQSIKTVLSEVLGMFFLQKRSDVADSDLTVKDVYEALKFLKAKMEDSSLPQRRDDAEEMSEESLDLISLSMFDEENYISTVVDYIFK